MVVGARNPEGVSCAQRISCHSPFRHPVLTVYPSSFAVQGSYSTTSIIHIICHYCMQQCDNIFSCLYRVH